jgi:hypothetical protein
LKFPKKSFTNKKKKRGDGERTGFEVGSKWMNEFKIVNGCVAKKMR